LDKTLEKIGAKTLKKIGKISLKLGKAQKNVF